MELQIILPPRSNDALSRGLRRLTKAVHRAGLADAGGWGLGGEFGYGADYENAVFLLHHYCWCDRTDCPWCVGCQCEHEGDGCEWCRGEHRWAEKGALAPKEWPHLGAPHFWHKPSGFRIWWYKYIGRDMEVYNPQKVAWPGVCAECLDSLKKEAK